MPKHISLAAAHKVLIDCAGVIWDDFILYPSVDDLSPDGNDEFMRLRAVNDEGEIFEASFVQNENERIYVDGSSMFLTDSEGEEVHLSILGCDNYAFDKCENIGAHEI